MKLNLTLITLVAFAHTPIQAATYSISASSVIVWKDSSDSALSRGDSATDGDGSVIQIGYFLGVSSLKDTSTFTTSDWAAFTPFTGLGSPNDTAFDTTIGDNVSNPGSNAPAGMYSLGISYNDAINNGLPGTIPPEIRLGVRVYNSTEGATGNFNTVTRNNSAWVLTKPHDDFDPGSDPQLVINNTTISTLTWQDGGANAFKTSITAVPEPSSFALLGLGGMALLFRRRK